MSSIDDAKWGIDASLIDSLEASQVIGQAINLLEQAAEKFRAATDGSSQGDVTEVVAGHARVIESLNVAQKDLAAVRSQGDAVLGRL